MHQEQEGTIRVLRLDEITGDICETESSPLQAPFTEFTVWGDDAFYTQIKSPDKTEIVFYGVERDSGKFHETQRLDITPLNGSLGAMSKNLRFFYTVTDEKLDDHTNVQKLHSFERIGDASYVERGVIDMGTSLFELTTNTPHVIGLTPDGKWLVVWDNWTAPHEWSNTVYAFPIDPVTGAATLNDWSVQFCCNIDSPTALFISSDGQYLVVLEDEFVEQRLRSWRLTTPQPVEAPSSRIDSGPYYVAPSLTPAGPSTYLLQRGDTISEWGFGVDGSLVKLGETSTPQPTGNDTPSFWFTPSGRVMFQGDFNRFPQQADVVIYLHLGPAQFERKNEYLIPGYIAGIFKAGE